MNRMLALALVLMAAAGCGGRTADETPDPAYVAAIDAWHADRVARLATDTGWLTLVGLHPLAPGFNFVGSDSTNSVRLPVRAPAQVGRIELLDDGRVMFLAAQGSGVHKADDATGMELLGCRLETDASGAPTVLACGTFSMHVIDRGGRLFLRVKDREAEALRDFAGIERFPVDPRWRVTAVVEPGGGTVAVPNVLGQVSDEASPGTLVFTLDGRTCRLTPTGEPGQGLFIVFADATNGPVTYGGGRFLSTDPPAADGTVVLDFNKAVNPPCAFSEYATCPLPPAGNTLAVAVTAGEKRYGAGH